MYDMRFIGWAHSDGLPLPMRVLRCIGENCECHDSSIVSSVLALETPEKEGRRTETSTSTPAPPQAAREKRKGSTDDW